MRPLRTDQRSARRRRYRANPSVSLTASAVDHARNPHLHDNPAVDPDDTHSLDVRHVPHSQTQPAHTSGSHNPHTVSNDPRRSSTPHDPQPASNCLTSEHTYAQSLDTGLPRNSTEEEPTDPPISTTGIEQDSTIHPIQDEEEPSLIEEEDEEEDVDSIQGAPPEDLNEIINTYSSTMFFEESTLGTFTELGEDTDIDDSHSEPDYNLSEDTPSRSKRVRHSNLTAEQASEMLQATKMQENLQKKMSKSILIGLVTVYGQSRFSLLAYRHLVTVMREHSKLPSPSTVRLRVFPYVLDNLTVKSTIAVFPTKSGRIGTVCQSSANSKSTELVEGKPNQAVIVFPSDWARFDIRCIHSFNELVCATTCRCHPKEGAKDIRIECTTFVRRKQVCASKPSSLWINRNGVPFQCSFGTVVSLHTYVEQDLPVSVTSSSFISLRASQVRKEPCSKLDATVLCTYSVQYNSQNQMSLLRGSLLPGPAQQQSIANVDRCATILERYFDGLTPGSSEPQPISTPSRTTTTDSSSFKLQIGDHVTILQAKDVTTQQFFVAFINRFWANRLDDDRQFIVFIPTTTTPPASLDWIPSFGVPEYVSSPSSASADCDIPNRPCLTTGVLPNGEKYVMYRLLLYADDFNARSPLFPKGSVGGVYMSPAGFSVRTRRSQKTIRTLSLTPSGVSTNYVLDYILDDLVSGSLDGFECVDPSGNKLKCFFDILGFLADYPASSAAVDVMGHSALAPCTHCTLVRLRSLQRSRYAFSTIIHSCNALFRRTLDRTASIRRNGLDKTQAKGLGMQVGDVSTLHAKGNSPLLKFTLLYNEHLRKSERPSPFNIHLKDGYDLNIIAPDHLLTGLMKGVLFCTFMQLGSEREQDHLQTHLKATLLDFGYQSQSVFFQNKKLVPGLSMTLMYAIFTVLPALLQSMGKLDSIPTKALITNLHSFVCLGFWWPSALTDGVDAWRLIHGNKHSIYHSALHKIACNFVRSVDQYVRKHRSLGSYVDRPNTHRLIELTVHTLPTYQHLLFVCELVFESAHQPLKYLLSKNNTANSHLHSVQVILIKDWMLRLHSAWVIYKSAQSTAKEKKLSMNTLIYLLCGAACDSYNWDSQHLRGIYANIVAHVESLLSGTVEDLFNEWYADGSLNTEMVGTWKTEKYLVKDKLSHSQEELLETASKDLGNVLNTRQSDHKYVSNSVFNRGFGFPSKTAHEKLQLGDVVQVLEANHYSTSRFVRLSDNGQGTIAFFVVIGIVETSGDELWLITRRCTPSAGNSTAPAKQIPDYNNILLYSYYIPPLSLNPDQSSPHYFYIRLDHRVRTIRYIHNCRKDGGCRFKLSTRTVAHSKQWLTGGHFFFIARNCGFPPRRS